MHKNKWSTSKGRGKGEEGNGRGTRGKENGGRGGKKKGGSLDPHNVGNRLTPLPAKLVLISLCDCDINTEDDYQAIYASYIIHYYTKFHYICFPSEVVTWEHVNVTLRFC